MSRVTEMEWLRALHLDQMQGKSSFGTWYKDAEVGNMIVQVMNTYARQQVERLGLT